MLPPEDDKSKTDPVDKDQPMQIIGTLRCLAFACGRERKMVLKNENAHHCEHCGSRMIRTHR